MLIGAASLYGTTTYAAEDDATFYPQLGLDESVQCLADYTGFGLNCTANDVRVSKVDNIKAAIENDSGVLEPVDVPVSCSPGEQVQFFADVEVVTTANERYDYAAWLPNGSYSPQESDPAHTCSVLIGDNRNLAPQAGEDDWIDGLSFEFDVDKKAGTQEALDYCTDISKADPYTGIHTYQEQLLTITCLDDDGSGKADFNYCMSWSQRAETSCDGETPTPAGAPSKCRCDIFDIDINIDPPSTVKTLLSTSSRDEPGGNFTFKIELENTNPESSLFLNSLIDYIDVGGLDTFAKSLDIWGPLTTSISDDGIYLVGRNSCPMPVEPETTVEILAGQTYSCEFVVKILLSDLPDLPLPDGSFEIFDDVVLSGIENEFGAPILDGDSCPTAVPAGNGDHCSNEKRVQIDNVKPTIDVVKTVNVLDGQLNETKVGTQVTYTVQVTNTSPSSADPVTITSITDAVNDNTAQEISGDDDCKVGTILEKGESCEFSYDAIVTGDAGDSIKNLVTVYAVDNENDPAQNEDDATILFVNVEGAIKVIKTPNPTSVPESGGTVSFNFKIINTSSVDNVTLKSLIDDTLFTDSNGVIFDDQGFLDDCNFYDTVLAPAVDPENPVVGEYVECSIDVSLKGEPGIPHENKVTVAGVTDSVIDCPEGEGYEPPCYEEVGDFDDATVRFSDVPPDFNVVTSLWFEFFIEATNNSTFETVYLDTFTLLGVPFEDGYIGEVEITPGIQVDAYEVINNGCPEAADLKTVEHPLGYPLNFNGGSINCSFKVRLIVPERSGFDEGGVVGLKFIDNDGVVEEPAYTVTVKMIKN